MITWPVVNENGHKEFPEPKEKLFSISYSCYFEGRRLHYAGYTSASDMDAAKLKALESFRKSLTECNGYLMHNIDATEIEDQALKNLGYQYRGGNEFDKLRADVREAIEQINMLDVTYVTEVKLRRKVRQILEASLKDFYP